MRSPIIYLIVLEVVTQGLAVLVVAPIFSFFVPFISQRRLVDLEYHINMKLRNSQNRQDSSGCLPPAPPSDSKADMQLSNVGESYTTTSKSVRLCCYGQLTRESCPQVATPGLLSLESLA